MLVLSRKSTETILLENLDVSIQILRIGKNSVRVGVEAPRNVRVIRGELAEQIGAVKNASAETNAFDISTRQKIAGLRNDIASCTHQFGTSDEVLSRLEEHSRLLDIVECELGAIQNGRTQTRIGAAMNPPPKNGKCSALVVDDNENECRLLSEYLRLKNVAVSTAHDGSGAWERIRKSEQLDCVLLDMNMPRFDGHWTIDRIRNDQKTRDMKIYVVSGDSAEDHQLTVGDGGVDQWFCKPVNPETIANAIHAEYQSASATAV